MHVHTQHLDKEEEEHERLEQKEERNRVMAKWDTEMKSHKHVKDN